MGNMNTVVVTFNRDMTVNELLEVKTLAEHQETTDKYTNVSLVINGDYANIEVVIDEFGDITVL